MKWTTEAKVGAFTIIGIVLFIAGILFVGRIDIWAKPQMTSKWPKKWESG